MSKQMEAKHKQSYVNKAHTCATCKMLTVGLKLPAWMIEANEDYAKQGMKPAYGAEFMVEKNLRCAIGSFKVKKQGVCAQIQPK